MKAMNVPCRQAKTAAKLTPSARLQPNATTTINLWDSDMAGKEKWFMPWFASKKYSGVKNNEKSVGWMLVPNGEELVDPRCLWYNFYGKNLFRAKNKIKYQFAYSAIFLILNCV
jgi:hypothetical protein